VSDPPPLNVPELTDREPLTVGLVTVERPIVALVRVALAEVLLTVRFW